MLLRDTIISPDGYNIGRDRFPAAAIRKTSFGGVAYTTVEQKLTGLLAVGSVGVNDGLYIPTFHRILFTNNAGIATDGILL